MRLGSLIFVTVLVLLSNLAQAQQLFDHQYSRSTKLVETEIWSCVEMSRTDLNGPSLCATLVEEQARDGCQSAKDSCVHDYPSEPHSDNTDVHNSGSGSFLGCNSNGTQCRRYSYTWTANLIRTEEAPTCPPDDHPTYRVLHYGHEGGLACWDRTDLLSRDSCPSGDITTFLPVGANTDPYVCVVKDDGSQCRYEMDSAQEYYEVNPENTGCYGLEPFAFDETGLTNPSGNTPQECYDIGNGHGFCIEDPNDYCPGGQCQEGCGYFSVGNEPQVFGCFSGDLDGDGVADYVDPDIDGDGIPNEDDLDSDGDGVDDPISPNQGNGNTVIVNVDTSRLEALQQATYDELAIQTDMMIVDTKEKGTFPTEEQLNLEIEEVTAELEAEVMRIKGEWNALFTVPEVTGQFSGCHDIATINGTTSQTCVDNFSDEVSVIGIAMLFIFGLLSVWIVFK